MGRLKSIVFVVALIGIGFFSASASAEEQSFSGEYEFNAARSDDMMEAFGPALEAMGPLKRSIARRMLSRAEPDQEVQIRLEGESILLRAGDREELRARINGDAVDYKTERGEAAKARVSMVGDELRVLVESKKGTSTSRYILSPDGGFLTWILELRYSDLPRAVIFKQVFDRR